MSTKKVTKETNTIERIICCMHEKAPQVKKQRKRLNIKQYNYPMGKMKYS